MRIQGSNPEVAGRTEWLTLAGQSSKVWRLRGLEFRLPSLACLLRFARGALFYDGNWPRRRLVRLLGFRLVVWLAGRVYASLALLVLRGRRPDHPDATRTHAWVDGPAVHLGLLLRGVDVGLGIASSSCLLLGHVGEVPLQVVDAALAVCPALVRQEAPASIQIRHEVVLDASRVLQSVRLLELRGQLALDLEKLLVAVGVGCLLILLLDLDDLGGRCGLGRPLQLVGALAWRLLGDRGALQEGRRAEVFSVVIGVLALDVGVILVVVRLVVLVGVLIDLLGLPQCLCRPLPDVFDGPWALGRLKPRHLAVLLLSELVVFRWSSFGLVSLE